MILFPEGTRGDPDEIQNFKSGIARLADALPNLLIYPVYLHGTAKVLPRGAWLFVPFVCKAFIGSALIKEGSKQDFLDALRHTLEQLRAASPPLNWF